MSVDELARLRAENVTLRNALEEIVDPVAKLRADAESSGAGCFLNGDYAVRLSESANYLKGIAAAALKIVNR